MTAIPKTVIGQIEVIRTLNVVAPAHVLLVANPGMGKTHIGIWYGAQVSPQPWRIDAPSIEEISYSPRSNWGNTTAETGHNIGNYPGAILVDEVQRLDNPEIFYPLLDKPADEGPGWARTYIFTTTDEGELPPALISRLQIIALAPYSRRELAQIAQQTGANLSYDVRLTLATMCHGSPRRTEQYARLLQNIAEKHRRMIKSNEVRGIMRYLGYPEGLNSRELQILKLIAEEPRSISTISSAMGTGPRTIRMWETELIAAGLMTISSRGRSATDKGRRILHRVNSKNGVVRDDEQVIESLG